MSKSLDKYIPKDNFRLKVYKKFYSLLPKHQKIAINIERCIFNYAINKLQMSNKILNSLFHFIYTNKAVVIYRNIDVNNPLKNTYLYPKVISGEITPIDLINFGPEKMFPERHFALQQKFKTEIVVTGAPDIEEDYVGAHQCRKCKSWRTTYYLLQKRRCDEAESVFVTCHFKNCGNKWNYNP